ncbi:HlyC/CorC family transporter [Litoribrevibacter euphylliae]|uniref:HlyC/CorC family transporter n=1 Tax=Litoribrevibacter euphylliae TaxID=1834034 RepID=A0ABV7HAR1_9GAMM
MNEYPIALLSAFLVFLIILSAFFSSSETGMMSLNRYRLKHLAKSGNRGAKNSEKLLKTPDKLISVILVGNNFVNILASAIATIIAVQLWGDAGIAIATTALTIVVLIFAEVTPKTIAALHPERIAFPASYILAILLKVLYPVIWLLNIITKSLLSLLGIRSNGEGSDALSKEELRTVLFESSQRISPRYKDMLVSIIDLEKVSVDDIMVPRNEVVGIDIDLDIEEIIEQIRHSQHTRMPVYKSDVNKVVGIVHLRSINRFLNENRLTKSMIMQATREPYFVPESTPLHTQMFNFQKEKRRIALVVDEYGDVQGIVTLEDILEEIVGEFTTDIATFNKDITPQNDGSFIIDGTAAIRDINKTLGWALPTEGPKTINGLIVEYLEYIPDANLSLKLDGYYIEILQVKENIIKSARIIPAA